jgi:hypothetical protein
MFKQTTIHFKKDKQEPTLVNQAFQKFNEATELLNANTTIEQLETKLEEQIIFKHNKEFLYTNCNRIKRRFYHYRDKNKHPRITVCILYDLKEGIACRGLSLCSFVDPTNKENGRDRAEDRAIQAYESMEDSERIVESVELFKKEIEEDYKSAYDVKLTAFEKRLFDIKNTIKE